MRKLSIMFATLFLACGDNPKDVSTPETETPGMCAEPEGSWKFEYTVVDDGCGVGNATKIVNFDVGTDASEVCPDGTETYSGNREYFPETCQVQTYWDCQFYDSSEWIMVSTLTVVNDTTLGGLLEFDIYDAPTDSNCYSKLSVKAHPL